MSSAGARWGRRALGWVLLAGSGAGAAADLPALRAGRVLAPVAVAPDAPEPVRAAAADLARVLSRMAGTPWPVAPAPRLRPLEIILGPAASARSPALRPAADPLQPGPGEVGPDAFQIHANGEAVEIESATPEAMAAAVAWFLGRTAGVTEYVPGEEEIPSRRDWTVPALDVLRAPRYVSRAFSGLETPAEIAWAARQGLRARLEFGHAVGDALAAEEWARHPDWVASAAADAAPAPGLGSAQPNLASPALAEAVGRAARAAFARDPARLSFPLGIRDSTRFDAGPATQALVRPLRFFRGRPDYSPLVFTFLNRAAAVAAEPGHYLGALAYFWCENVPPFRVAPNVIPYLTADRSQDYDPAFRQEDLDLLRRWGASGVRAFGLWEYAFGRGYIIPRLPLAALAASLRAGAAAGARGYFAELEPHWGFDGFKAWALARLLWDPEVSLAALAAEFYPGYYHAAARPMEEFFAACEEQWMRQAGPASWLRYYREPDQAAVFPEAACQGLQRLLATAAQAVADDPAAARRVARTGRALAVTAAYAAVDRWRQVLAGPTDAELTGAVGAELARVALPAHAAAVARFQATVRQALQGDAAGLPALRGVEVDALLRDQPARRVEYFATDPGARTAAGTAGVLRNPRFEELTLRRLEPRFLYARFGALPADWTVRALPTERGRIGLDDGADGDPAQRRLRFSGQWDAQVFQWYPAGATPRWRAEAELRGRGSRGGEASLYLTFLDAGRNVLASERQNLPADVTVDWRTQVLVAATPPGAHWVGAGVTAARQGPDDWLEVRGIQLHALPPP